MTLQADITVLDSCRALSAAVGTSIAHHAESFFAFTCFAFRAMSSRIYCTVNAHSTVFAKFPSIVAGTALRTMMFFITGATAFYPTMISAITDIIISTNGSAILALYHIVPCMNMYRGG